MKDIKFAVAAVTLPALSFGVFVAGSVSSTQAQNMNKIGVVFADGATTPDDLETKLTEKVNAASATGYNITSAIDKDKMSGTAAIYK